MPQGIIEALRRDHDEVREMFGGMLRNITAAAERSGRAAGKPVPSGR